jgi:CheY-like chemotaxis protein
VAPVRRPAHAPLVADKAARAALKVARRGAVRRDRLQSTAAASAAAPDVLVLDADDTACHQMCSLLRGFGFGVRSTANVAEAFALATAQPFVAVFADVALDGSGGGIGLFQHVRGTAQRHGAGSTLLVLAAARLSHIDRVRAELAGCDEAITKPVSRGSVARVLDSHGVALPSDARRV